MRLSFKHAAIAPLAALSLLACSQPAQAPADASAPTETAPAADAGPPLTRLAQDASLQWGPCPSIFPAGCEIAVLHGDPAQPNADVFLRTPGGYEIPAHTHSSAERMILVAGELNVQYQGTPMTPLTAGEYAYGPAGSPHRATCVSTAPCVLFIAFEGPVDALLFEGAL